MRKVFWLAMALLIPLTLSSVAMAQTESGFFVLGKASSLGVGGDVGYKFNNYVAAKVNVNGISWYFGKFHYSGISFSGTANLINAGALIDVYPLGGLDNGFAKNFYVSGGVYLNWNEARATTSVNPLQMYSLGRQQVLGAGIGSPTAKLKYNLVDPYVGIGWQGWFTPQSNWQFQFNAGILFQGPADVKITGYNAATPGVTAGITHIRSQIKSVADGYQVYPVISLGIGYKF